MSDNYDPQVQLTIDYLKEQITDCDKWYLYWKERHQYPQSIDRMATCRDRENAFRDVLEFIEENYKTDDNGK